MRIIDESTWKRRAHFQFFSKLDYPHFNVVAPLDVTRLRERTQAGGLSFFKSVLHAVARTANELPEFRQRIRGQMVVEHEVVHPSYTHLGPDELFRFTHVKYSADLGTFLAGAAAAEQASDPHGPLYDEPGRDDFLYVSSLPWLAFTSISHPIHMHPVDSVPRISWGRFASEGGLIRMPVSVQAHHALVDGFHVGQFFERLQQNCDSPA